MQKIRLTTRAKILLWFCAFIPYRYHKTAKRRRTFLWPIEKITMILKTLTIERAVARRRLDVIEAKYIIAAFSWPKGYLENLRIYHNADSQVRGYLRLAKKKRWVK